MTSPYGPRPAARFPAVALGVVVGGCVVALAALCAVSIGNTVRRVEAERVAQRSAVVVEALDRRLQSYVDGVQSAAAFFTVASEPEPFARFADGLSLPERYPGIQVLGHASAVDATDLDAFVASTRAALERSGLAYPTFGVHPTPGAVDVVVIDRVDPIPGNEAAVGFDFLSEPGRRAAVEATRDTGLPAATPPVTLVQETGDQRGFLVMIAVYRPGMPVTTVAERRAAFTGVAYAAFRMGDLVDGAVGDRLSGELAIHDTGPTSAAAGGVATPTPTDLMYASAGTDPAASGATTMELDVAGRRWTIAYRETADVLSWFERRAALVVVAAGVLIGALAGWLVATLQRSRARALSLAESMTAELRASEARLARSNEELERFAYVASHDLQEPLRTVGNFVGLLERTCGDELGERGRRYAALAVDGAVRMSTMIDHLLTYSRADRHRESVPTSLERAWDVAVGNLDAAIGHGEAVVTHDPLPVVLADHDDVVQVVQNLLENAVKYRRGDVAHVHASARRRGDEWHVSISDDGIGIDPAYHDDVFVMFRRLHARDAYPGTGMGLAIVKRLVEAHGGSIALESEPGRGSTFTVTFRAAPDDVAAATPPDRELLGAAP